MVVCSTILLSKLTHCSLTSGSKWVYKSIVILIELCPSWCWTYFIWTPFARAVGWVLTQQNNRHCERSVSGVRQSSSNGDIIILRAKFIVIANEVKQSSFIHSPLKYWITSSLRSSQWHGLRKFSKILRYAQNDGKRSPSLRTKRKRSVAIQFYSITAEILDYFVTTFLVVTVNAKKIKQFSFIFSINTSKSIKKALWVNQKAFEKKYPGGDSNSWPTA